MRIWIDGYEANVPQRLGSSQVALNLLKSFYELDKNNDYTVVLPSKPLEDLPPQRDNWHYKVSKINKLWTILGLPAALFTSSPKPDLIFSPTHYIPKFSPCKRVVTIFDLAFLHYPEMFLKADLWKLTHWTKSSIQNADHIITISSSTKDDILKNYKVDKDKVTVAYPGYDSDTFFPIKDSRKIQEIKDKYGISGEYIIFIGTIQPRKNLPKLIEAFATLKNLEQVKNLKLVIVGKTRGEGRAGWMFEETLKRPEQLGISDRVIFTGFTPTEDLPFLINGATAFILPSLYEGFGIPVVDAMACGCPVIVSNVSSLPEVVGSAGLLVNPKSTDEIAQSIVTIATDQKLRSRKIKECLDRAKEFSWDKMAKTVLKVFEQFNF